MEKNVNVNNRGGIGICGLLTIVFIVLKLCGVIAWEWFWVCFPAIVGVGIGILSLLLSMIICIIVAKKGE